MHQPNFVAPKLDSHNIHHHVAVNVKHGTVRTPEPSVHTFELFREEDVHLECHRVADELEVDGPDFSQIFWSDDCSAFLS